MIYVIFFTWNIRSFLLFLVYVCVYLSLLNASDKPTDVWICFIKYITQFRIKRFMVISSRVSKLDSFMLLQKSELKSDGWLYNSGHNSILKLKCFWRTQFECVAARTTGLIQTDNVLGSSVVFIHFSNRFRRGIINSYWLLLSVTVGMPRKEHAARQWTNKITCIQ